MRTEPVAELKIGEDGQLAGDEALADVIAPVEVLEQFWKPADPKFRVSILVQRRIETLALNSGPDVEEAERLIGKPKPTGDVDPNCPFHILRRDLLRFDIVSTLTWLKAWLNNDLTSVPKLAIYNQNSGFQGYDPQVDPQLVQLNGLAVLRFLQSKCKGDPGVYWLYKSAEEDEIKLFDFSTTSKNHSSYASSLPLVLHACAREQLARLIMTNEKEFEPKTAEEESFLAVDHISQAIKFLTDTQKQLPSSEQEGDWLSTSIIDKKLWGLIMLLGESYLSLGEAYKEEEKQDQALRTIKLACSIYGSSPLSYDKTLFDSTLRDSISRPFDIPKFGKWVKEVEYSTKQVKNDTSLKQLSPEHLFWAKVWLLVGDIYAKFIIPLSSEGSEVVEEEVRLHIEEVVNTLKKKLTACTHECASCSLVNCLCLVDKGKGKEEERGGIFKYLKESRKDDAETNLFAALHCYGQVQKVLPSGCKELLSLHVRKAWVWHGISMEYFKSKKFKDSEEAMVKSAQSIDEIKLFDFSTTSKNHSSCASSLPLVLHACAREQLARLIMTNEKEFEPKTAEEESFLAVDHISQAIKFLTDPQKQLPSSEQEGDWLSTSIIDKKLWGLIMLLGESYLSLGEAYKEEEKLDQALRTIKEACSIYGSLPLSYDKTLFDSTLRDSISRLFDIPKFGKWVNEEEYSTKQVEDDTSLKQLSPKHLFWVKVWLLVGDIYAKFIIPLSSEGSEVVTEKKVVKKEVRLRIEEVVNMLKKKLTVCRHECASCSLVNCPCPVDKGKGKGKGGSHSSKSRSKEEGGIFKYLKESRKNDAETNLFNALHCYDQVQKVLPSGCKELLSLHVRNAWAWHEISMKYGKSSKFKESEDAMVQSAQACMDSGDYVNLIGCYSSLGSLRRILGSEKEKQMMKYKPEQSSGKARKKALEKDLELATKEYIRSLEYYMEAKKGVSRALEEGRKLPETLRDDVQLKLADTYLVFGRLLCVNYTTGDAPTELKSTSENTQDSRLSADDAVREALALFKSLGKDKDAYVMLAAHHESCYDSILDTIEKANKQAGLAIKKWNDAANKQADLAIKNWNDAMECYGPEINHPDSVFMSIVTKRSAFYFKSRRQSEFVIDLELRRFLVCHRISEEDEKKIDGKDVENFLQQLQNILREMLRNDQSSEKLKKLYRKSLNATSLSSLKDMHDAWTSD